MNEEIGNLFQNKSKYSVSYWSMHVYFNLMNNALLVGQNSFDIFSSSGQLKSERLIMKTMWPHY